MAFDLNFYGTELPTAEDAGKKPLPDYCHKCGRCCKSATTYFNNAKLHEMAANGDEDAIAFLEIFTPFDSIEEARAAVPEQIEQVLKVVHSRPDMKLEDITFYHCKYVSAEGLCGIYEHRPRFCREAPGNGWSAMPPGCGFEGWQFWEREKHKKMIRDLKTSAYTMEALSPDGKTHPTRPDTTIAELNDMVAQKIKPWKPYGADHW
jgi:Fe-S-cluster containining protein